MIFLHRYLLLILVLVPTLAAGPAVPHFKEAPSPGEYAFQAYGQDDGLLSLAVSSMAQDTDGVLWVGTEDGLFWLDGQQFHPLGEKEGLNSTLRLAVWPDPSHGIWVSTSERVFRVIGKHAHLVETLPDGPTRSMAWDREGRTWIAMGRHGLFRERTVGGSFERMSAFGPTVLVARADRAGGMVVITLDGQVSLLKDDGSVNQLCPPGSIPILDRNAVAGGFSSRTLDCVEDGEGRIWLLTQWGLSHHDPNTSTFIPFDHPALDRGGGERGMAKDGKGGLWVATIHGLLHIHDQTWTLLTDHQGLPTKTAHIVLVDREGSLWYSGIGLFRQMGLGAFTNFTPREGLPTELAWGVCRDKSGRMWAGTEQGLVRWDGNRWVKVPGSSEGSLYHLLALPNGGVLAVGRPQLVVYIPPGANEAKRVSVSLEHEPNPLGMQVFLDRSGIPWLVGHQEIRRLELVGDTFRARESHVAPEPGYLYPRFKVEQDQTGTCWFATNKGLVSWSQGKWRRWTHADGLAGDSILGLQVAPDGTLLLCFVGYMGLWRYRIEGDHLQLVRSYRAGDGALPSDTVYSVHLDHLQRIWVLTNLGAARLTEEGYRVFNRTHGLPSAETIQSSFFDEGDGIIWWSNAKSLVRFDTRIWPWDLPIPTPKIVSVSFGDKPVAFDGPLIIPSEDNSLGLSLGCLSYAQARSAEFELRLDGLDHGWRRESQPRLTYLSLPLRSYHLRIRTLIDGRFGPETRLDFTILPRWYQTWWSRVLGAMSAAMLVMGFSRLRQRQLSRANIKLEALVSERTRELEAVDEIVKSINQQRSLDDLVKDLLDQGLLHFPAAWRIGLLLLQADAPVFQLKAVRCRSQEEEVLLTGLILPYEEATIHYLKSGRELENGIIQVFLPAHPRQDTDLIRVQQPQLMLAMGIEVDGTLEGILFLDYMTGPGDFLPSDVSRLARFREHAISAVAKALQQTKIEAAMERLHSLDQQKTEALGIVAHELRSPLSVITMAAELLGKGDAATEENRIGKTIQQEALGMAGFINRLLDISAIESGRMQLQPTSFSLLELTGQVISNFERRAKEKGIELSLVAAPGPCHVYGDPRLLREVLENLVSNALKFSPAGKEVRVSLDSLEAEEKVSFSVQDQGPGLVADDHNQLFSRFARLSTRPTGGEKSTGLGLYIVKRLVDAMGGRISVESEPGSGARFTVEMPRGTDVQTPEESVDSDQAFLGSVLIADDNNSHRMVMGALLQQLGLKVKTVADGEEALEALEQETFDLTFLDIQMPRRDGLSTLAEIRTREASGGIWQGAHQILVVVTGQRSSEGPEGYLKAGFDEFLPKPLDAGALRAMLVRRLGLSPLEG